MVLPELTEFPNFPISKSIIEAVTPFHLASRIGNFMAMCKSIVDSVENKSPRDELNGETPLHYAVCSGNYEICQMIIERIEDKNPKDNIDWTPLHEAAKRGHLNICQLIAKYTNNKNPQSSIHKITPLDQAVNEGHLEVVTFFCEIIREKNPKSVYTRHTPLQIPPKVWRLCFLSIPN